MLKLLPSPTKPNPRTPATPPVAEARRLAAHVRVALAVLGGLLLAFDRTLPPDPLAAGIGLLILAATGLLLSLDLDDRWLRIEEPLACSAGVLLITLGPGEIDALTLIWLVSVVAGVLARGGRVAGTGRVLILAILASPLVRHGVTADSISLLAAGTGVLLAVGRMSVETSQLLRDPLTGVLSRGAFDAQVARWAENATGARPAGLIMIDLDDFGIVNKRHGHRAGDLFLRRAVSRIAGAVRSQDLVGRIGGDEFAVLTSCDDAEALAGRIIAAVAEAGIGASAGVAYGPRDGADARSLFAAADVAMRRAKRQGKGCVSLYGGPPLEGEDAEQALDRLCAGDGVSMAIQPIVDLRFGTVHAYEALARFAVREPGEGPMHWFSLADRLGRRRDLERACLRNALELLKVVGEGALLTVNLSAELLDDPEVLAAVESTPGVDQLVLELNGNQAAQSSGSVHSAIARLRACGVRFAVDSVGTGQDGLSQLALVRPDYLKLDRSVLGGMDGSPDRERLVRSLADYVRDSECVLIAEGVETQAELGSVRAASIDLVQGYLLGPPSADGHTDRAALRLAHAASMN